MPYAQHQYKKHGTKRKGSAFPYACGLNRCSAHLHETMEAFKSHVETSHMKMLPFHAPYNVFLKERDLISHFEQNHSDLKGLELDLHSELLLPSWEPRRPIRPLPAPPDLPPGKIHPATFRLEPPPKMRPDWFSRTPTPSLTLIPLTPKPKPPVRPLLRTASVLSVSSAAEREPETQYDFADLPVVGYDQYTSGMVRYESTAQGLLRFHPYAAPRYFVVQPVGAEVERVDLVRPLPMPQAPMRESALPPTTIFYEALRQQVFAQYALGEDAISEAAAPLD
ncbi:hypothetical protein B0H12DRAFT_1145643 [Mycena haematopus]|nr:hypothetical protein B0H12DRAFT_1145643 [Mycena haematopus]